MTKQAENTMSAATDKGVLAVLDLAQGSLRLAARGGNFALEGNKTMAHQDSIAIAEARATVAELIEAAAAYRTATAMGMHLAASRKRLDAALARCGGAQ